LDHRDAARLFAQERPLSDVFRLFDDRGQAVDLYARHCAAHGDEGAFDAAEGETVRVTWLWRIIDTRSWLFRAVTLPLLALGVGVWWTRDYCFVTRRRLGAAARRALLARRAVAGVLEAIVGLVFIACLVTAIGAVAWGWDASHVTSTTVLVGTISVVAALPVGVLYVHVQTAWIPAAWRSISRGVFRPSRLEWGAD